MSMHRVNCWDALKPLHHSVAGNGERDGSKSQRMHQWAISSQAAERSVEGSTDRAWSLLEAVKPHECAAADESVEDISWSVGKPAEVEHKQLGGNTTRRPIGQRSDVCDSGASRMALLRGHQCARALPAGRQSALLHADSRRQASNWGPRVAMREFTLGEFREPYVGVETDTAILSQAVRQRAEGAETRSWSPTRTVKTHERPASLWDGDIVRYSDERRRARLEQRAQRKAVRSTMLVPPRRWRNLRNAWSGPERHFQQRLSFPAEPVETGTPDHHPRSSKHRSEGRVLHRRNHERLGHHQQRGNRR